MPRPPTNPIVASAVILVAAAAYLAFGPALKQGGVQPGLTPRESGSIRVVSWNLEASGSSTMERTGDRSAEISEVLSRMDAQAICLQFAWDSDEPERIRRRLGDSWTVASVDAGDGLGWCAILLAPEIHPIRRELISGPSGWNALAYVARTAGGREFMLLSVSIGARVVRQQVSELTGRLKNATNEAVVLAVGSLSHGGDLDGAAGAMEELRARLSGEFVDAVTDAGTTIGDDHVFVSRAAASSARALRVVGGVPEGFAHQPLVVDIIP